MKTIGEKIIIKSQSSSKTQLAYNKFLRLKGWYKLHLTSYHPLIKENIKHRNIHRGERCFVLATGPSIQRLDLSCLDREFCIATSEFFRHPDYKTIKPQYYVRNPIHEPFTSEDFARATSALLGRSHGQETFFFGLSDRPYLLDLEKVPDTSRINFLSYSLQSYFPEELLICRPLPSPASVAITATWIAMYMGFSEIYLLGCDYNKVWTWKDEESLKPNHFYNDKPILGFEPEDIEAAMLNTIEIRRKFKITLEIAKRNKCRIYNASPKSKLDVVPKAKLEELSF